MGIKTNIQRADSTVNPTMGCDGCELRNPAAGVRKCYAGTLHDRYGGKTKGYSPSFEVITPWPGRMAEAADGGTSPAPPARTSRGSTACRG